jgi:hypothetical protein
MAGEGSLRERGAKPPLKFFPPFKHKPNRTSTITLSERGIKGVSIDNQYRRSEYFDGEPVILEMSPLCNYFIRYFATISSIQV